MKLLQPLLDWSKGSQPGDSATTPLIAPSGTKADSRFHGRFKITNRVTLSGEDGAGETWRNPGRGVDMSRLGAPIQTGDPVAPGSSVFIQVQEFSRIGGAVLKYF